MSDAEIAVVVLAAGTGSRFGGIKQLAEVEGKPLLSRVLETLSALEGPRVVVLGAAAEAVRVAVPEKGWEVVLAGDWEAGQGASLRAGLAAVAEAGTVLIALGDLPWLRWEAVERVLAAAASAPAGVEAIRACEADVPGHPLLIRGSLLERAREAPDEGMRPLLRAAALEAVDCTGLGAARDVDTRADLEP